MFLLSALLAFGAAAAELPGEGRYERRTVEHLGLTRKYLVYLPSEFRTSQSLPLVMVLHGGGGDAESAVYASRMSEKADRERFIVMYPEGSGRRAAGKHFGAWNAGRCCGPARDQNVDDVGFLTRALNLVVGEFGADPKRVYATGFSNGALMTYRLACEIPDRLAAVAPVAGQAVVKVCEPKRPVPILHLHGREDPCTLYSGGKCGGCFGELFGLKGRQTWACEGVEAHVAGWARRQGCSETPRETLRRERGRCVSWPGCAAEVALCSIEGQGHVWPGGGYGPKACEDKPNGAVCRRFKKVAGPAVDDLAATDVMWDFFRKFKR